MCKRAVAACFEEKCLYSRLHVDLEGKRKYISPELQQGACSYNIPKKVRGDSEVSSEKWLEGGCQVLSWKEGQTMQASPPVDVPSRASSSAQAV